MKTYILSLLLVSQCVMLLAQDNKSPYLVKSLANDDIKNVFVNTAGGSIAVSGEAGQAPRVEVYVRSNSNKELTNEEIKRRLSDDYVLAITVSGHEVHATAKSKHEGGFNFNWRQQLNISFKVFVPKQSATHLNTSGGSIHLDNLAGSEQFSTSGGSLHLNELSGVIKGETSGGSIEITNSRDNINLETSGGSIRANNCQGNIRLETSGGSLHLENLNGIIHANTSGGSVQANTIQGELITGTSGGSVNLSRLSCSLEASTSGGGMNIEILHAGKYIKLDDSGGHVDLQLPARQGLNLDLVASRINKPLAINNFSGEWDKDRVKGTVNGGGIPVHVDASGHLDVRFN